MITVCKTTAGEAKKLDELTQEYLVLFSAVTAAEQTLAELRKRLVEAQQRAEELYISRL